MTMSTSPSSAAPDRGRARSAVLLVVAGVLLATSTYLSFGPLPVQLPSGRGVCPAGFNAVWALAPTHLPPRSDPGYVKAAACDRVARAAAPYGFGLEVPAALVLLAWSRYASVSAAARRRP